MEGQMNLSGQLSDWSVSDLLQIMQVTKKTGSLDLVGERHARVFFRDGNVTGAELVGSTGSYHGSDRSGIADVLYVLSGMSEGQFSVGPAGGTEGKGWPIDEVLTDVEVLRALEGDVVDAGLFEASGVRLIREIDAPLNIDPPDWSVISTLVQPFSFSHLEARFGRGTAIRLFHTLHRLGLAEAVDLEEGETAWLDRLAQDVAPSAPVAPSPAPAVEEAIGDPEVIIVPAAEPDLEPEPAASAPTPVHHESKSDDGLKGVAAPASTTLTDGVYDEIRRLRSRVVDK